MSDQLLIGSARGGVRITIYKRIGASGRCEFFTYTDREPIPVSQEWIRCQKEPLQIINLTEEAGE